MDDCNKWQKRKLQKLAKGMYRICFDFTRRCFGVSLFFTQKNSEIFESFPFLKLGRSEGIDICIICWLKWKWGLPVVTVFLAKYKDLGTRNYV